MSVLKSDISQVLSAVPWLLSLYLQCFSSFYLRRAILFDCRHTSGWYATCIFSRRARLLDQAIATWLL